MNATLLSQPLARPPTRPASDRIALTVADETDREEIYRLRHQVYAAEFGQHPTNLAGILRDRLDETNVYLVARTRAGIAGFISITPPQAPAFSIDKYFPRAALPFAFDDQLHEVRLLTVLAPHRGRELATLLMYAAYRWVEAHGGTRLVGLGRREVMDLYRRVGLQPVGLSTQGGAVTFDLVLGLVPDLRRRAAAMAPIFRRLESRTSWRLAFPFRPPAACFHGGAFFSAVGEDFTTLERRHEIVNADVLDAWFPPAPGVTATLAAHLPWLLRTSPPTSARGLIAAIASARGVRPENILPGAGSSDLIFRAFREWLRPESRVLILEPTYGEYAHVLEQVIGCRLDRLTLDRAENYDVNLPGLRSALGRNYDLVALVNPNSPTGRHVPRAALAEVLASAPPATRIWVDETYVEYSGVDESLERFAAATENVIVAKSMSKVYALSGARVAYLCAGPHQLEALRAITPPWVVGLPAQVAAVRALEDPAYYAARYRETARHREELAAGLRALGGDVGPGVANFVLCHLPACGPTAAAVVARAREQGIFLRDAARMGVSLGPHALRVAVKSPKENRRIITVLQKILRPPTA